MLSIMSHKALKVTAWTIGALVAIPVAAYAAAILVNRHDQPPSPDALRLAASYQTRPEIANDDNAFVYFLGFNSALDANPRDVGARRLLWLQGDGPLDASSDPLVAPLDYLGAHPDVARFRTACDAVGADCLRVLPDAGRVFEQWTAAQPWLLERYRQLIAHRGWREHVPDDITVPLPSYSGIMHGQRLLLLQATTLAAAGNGGGAAELLDSDLRFWRMVLESSDLLVTKMIAAAAMQRHFQWGNLALRALPAEETPAAPPVEWRAPLTATELSLHRTLVGEWMYFSGTVTKLPAGFSAGESWTARASNRLLLGLFQPQDTLNRYSTYFTELDSTLNVPLRSYPDAAGAASSLVQRTAGEAFPPRSLYNVMGSVLVGIAGPADYSDYARRLGDLEGIRRAALATATLRAEGTPASAIGAALGASSLRNPYDDGPLGWDADAQAVVFVGLEPGERGEHRFYY
jgi:hypothetical protein